MAPPLRCSGLCAIRAMPRHEVRMDHEVRPGETSRSVEREEPHPKTITSRRPVSLTSLVFEAGRCPRQQQVLADENGHRRLGGRVLVLTARRRQSHGSRRGGCPGTGASAGGASPGPGRRCSVPRRSPRNSSPESNGNGPPARPTGGPWLERTTCGRSARRRHRTWPGPRSRSGGGRRGPSVRKWLVSSEGGLLRLPLA